MSLAEMCHIPIPKPITRRWMGSLTGLPITWEGMDVGESTTMFTTDKGNVRPHVVRGSTTELLHSREEINSRNNLH